MMLLEILLLATLLAVAGVSLAALWGVIRAREKHRVLGEAHGRSCETMDCIGVSALACDVCDLAQVENLLAVEYARYEVILVLDSRLRGAEFAAIVSRYRMIGVDYVRSGEFPSDGVRALYRSRKRGFRRLVVVDRARDTPAGDLDAAAGVAAYDYLLPVGAGQLLLPDAVERLVIEVGERPEGTLGLVRSCVGEPAFLYCRDIVAAAGGFASRPDRLLPRQRKMCLWEPLFRRERHVLPGAGALRLVAGLMLAGGVAAGLWGGYAILLAILLTVALVWGCAAYAAQLLEGTGGTAGRLYSGWRTEDYKKFYNS